LVAHLRQVIDDYEHALVSMETIKQILWDLVTFFTIEKVSSEKAAVFIPLPKWHLLFD